MKSKYKKISFVFFFFIIAIFFIKIFYLSNLIYEFDDVGPFLAHKFYPTSKSISIFGHDFFISSNFINNIEDSLLFPLYIAYNWTYAPGHYIFYIFFNISEFDSSTKVFFIRIFSLTFSLISVVLLFNFLLNKLKLNFESVILTCSILATSINFNLYSMHGSPYTTFFLSTLIGAILIKASLRKKNLLPLISINSFLIFFNYLNVIFYIIFLYILIKDKKFLYNLKIISKKKKYLIINFLSITFFFIIIFLKYYQNINLSRGNLINTNVEFLELFTFIFFQFCKSFNFLIYGGLPNPNPEIILSNMYIHNMDIYSKLKFIIYPLLFLIMFTISILKNSDHKNYLICCSIYLIIWLLFYLFNKLPLDASRHSLIYFPILLILFAISISNYKSKKIKVLFMSFSFIVILNGMWNLTLEIEKRKNKYVEYFKIIKEQNIKNIFLYEDAIWIKNFAKKNEFQIYDFNYKIFRKTENFSTFPEKAIMIGQNGSFDEFRKNLKFNYEILKDKESLIGDRIKNNYHITEVFKELSNENFAYKSKSASSGNNMYIYVLEKKL